MEWSRPHYVTKVIVKDMSRICWIGAELGRGTVRSNSGTKTWSKLQIPDKTGLKYREALEPEPGKRNSRTSTGSPEKIHGGKITGTNDFCSFFQENLYGPAGPNKIEKMPSNLYRHEDLNTPEP